MTTEPDSTPGIAFESALAEIVEGQREPRRPRARGRDVQRAWLDLAALAEYSHLSPRFLRALIHDPLDPLPASRIGKKLLVLAADFDDFARRRRVQPGLDLGAIVDEVVAEVTGG